MAAVNPYLHFNGTCKDAFTYYHSIFGGDAPHFSRFSDRPAGEDAPANADNLIMHTELHVNGGTALMGSDVLPEMGTFINGSNFTVSIQADSEEEAKRLFEGLAAGGEVTMPLQQTFWGSTFGMFTDKFGVPWMINYSHG